MTRTITASILALSIGFSSLSVTPAHAGNNNDLGRFVAGALVLFAIGKAIEGSNRPRTNVTRAPSNPKPYPITTPQRTNKRLPEQCFFRVRSPNGPRGVYGKICLGETLHRADRLPQNCRETVRVRNGLRSEVFGAQCLRNYGYRTATHGY
ncbi:MAG: hypothetical protein V3V25_14420 [Paracoccaceae bacterium]